MNNPITVPYKNNTTKFHTPNLKPYKKITFGNGNKVSKTKKVNPIVKLVQRKVLGSVFGQGAISRPNLTPKGIKKTVKNKIGLGKPKTPQIVKNIRRVSTRIGSAINKVKSVINNK